MLGLKKHIRLGHAGIADHSVDLSIPDFKKSIKNKPSVCSQGSEVSGNTIYPVSAVVQSAMRTCHVFVVRVVMWYYAASQMAVIGVVMWTCQVFETGGLIMFIVNAT